MPKLKNKKWWKRAVIGIGGMTTIIAPVVSTVAYDTKSAAVQQQGCLQPLGALLNKPGVITPISGLLQSKIESSDFYKSHLKTTNGISYWKITTKDELKKTLDDLQKVDASIFSDEEKRSIANAILQSSSYTNMIKNFGFKDDVGINGGDVSKENGNLVNSFGTTNLGISNVGQTGYAINYGIYFDGYNNIKLFDFSNSDILKYFESLAFVSSGFKDLYSLAYNCENSAMTDNHILVNFVSKWNTSVDIFYKKLSSYTEDLEFLKTIPEFKFIQKIEGSAPTTNDEAYKLLLHSSIISKAMADETVKANEQNYDGLSVVMKRARWVELVDSITTTLFDYNKKALENLKGLSSTDMNIVEQIKDVEIASIDDFKSTNSKIKVLVSNDEANYLLFASKLLHLSTKLTNDVVIKVYDDLFYNDFVLKPGITHNTSLSETGFKLPFYQLSENGDLGSVFGDAKIAIGDRGGSITLTDSINDEHFLGTLTADLKSVMSTDYAIYYAIKIEVNGNYFSPRLIVYENDHDNDNALKNVAENRPEGAWSSWKIGFDQVIKAIKDFGKEVENISSWEDFLSIVSEFSTSGLYVVPEVATLSNYKNVIVWHPGPTNASKEIVLTEGNQYPTIYLNFFRNQNVDNTNQDDSTTFHELSNAIGGLFDKLWTDWQSSHKSDPLVSYTPTLTIKSFTFPSLKFQTYNDSGWDNTHSNNFRFDDVIMHYEWRVDASEN